MEEEITIWYYKDNYMCTLKTNTTVYFRTLKEHLELAYYDTITSTLYFNSLYDGRFTKAKRQIMIDFKPNEISEYFDIGNL